MPRTVPWYCVNDACLEYDAAVIVHETYSAGAWWPDRQPICDACDAELEPERPDASALDDHSTEGTA